MSALQQHLNRLQIKLPAVQTGAVEAALAHLKLNGGISSKDGTATLTLLLGHSSQAVVAVAVDQLCSCKALLGLSYNGTVDLLLSSLPGAVHVAELVNGLLSLFVRGAQEGTEPLGWTQNILSGAVLACPEVQEHLLPGFSKLMASLDRCNGPERQRIWAHLQPFLSFALLDPDTKGERPTLAPSLHAELVRLSLPAHPTRSLLLGLLCSQACCLSLSTPQRRLWVPPALRDLLGAILAQQDDGNTAMYLTAITDATVQLCTELYTRKHALNILLLGSLRTIGQSHPELLTQHLGTLAAIASGDGEGSQVYAVIGIVLGTSKGSAAASLSAMPGLQQTLVQPAIYSLTFKPSLKEKAWAGHVLAMLEPWQVGPLPELPPPSSLATSSSLEAAAATLAGTFQGKAGSEAAITWLRTLRQALQQQGKGEKPYAQSLSPSLLMLLTALLLHPERTVQLAALQAVAAVPTAYPLMGTVFLPILSYLLQAPMTPGSKDDKQAAGWQLAILKTIPSMATDSACIPFCLQLIKPLSAPGSPEILQALALRLETRLWHTSRRNFARLQAILLGFVSPGSKPGIALRVARAASARDVCDMDPGKGTELVTGIQEMLADSSDAVAALGLECVSLLCRADALDFYAAWPVVQNHFPTLPRERPQVAMKWVGLLAHGAMDAKAVPEEAVKVVQLLWLAAKDESAEVRGKAYEALAGYSLHDLELLEALRPLNDFSQLLLTETDDAARRECMLLVERALAFEHSIRRRFIPGRGKARGLEGQGNRGPESALLRRLCRVLPKSLLAAPGNLLTGSQLLLWMPPPAAKQPLGAQSNAQAAAAAYAAFAASRFLSAKTAAISGNLGHHGSVIQAWRSFMGRWLAAEIAAQGEVGSRLQAAKDIMQQLHTIIVQTSQSADSSLLAAGTLCSILQEEGNEPASELLPILLLHARSDSSAATVKAANIAIGLTAPFLHPTDIQGRIEASSALLEGLKSSASADVRAACGEALGVLVAGLAVGLTEQEIYKAHTRRVQLMKDLLGHLLLALSRFAPELEPGAAQALQDLNVSPAATAWAETVQPGEEEGSEFASISTGIFAGLAHAAKAATLILDGPEVLSLLTALTNAVKVSMHQMGMQGACLALSSFVIAALEEALTDVEGEEVKACMAGLQKVLQQHHHGAVRGAAAAAMGSLFPLVVTDTADLKDHWIPTLVSALAAAQKVPSSARLVTGVAAGLGALLGAGGQVPGAPACAQLLQPNNAAAEAAACAALKALESMAESSAFIQSAQRIQWVLAAVCMAARRQARQLGAYASGSGATDRVPTNGKGMEGLQADGAMLPLASYLLTVSREGLQEAETAILVMRCLTAAERLPQLDWGSVCWFFLGQEGKPGLGIQAQAAALQLAVSHATLPSSGLSTLIDDLMQPAAFWGLHNRLQRQVLKQLPAVLAGLSMSRRNEAMTILTSELSQQPDSLKVAAWQGLRACLEAAESPVPAATLAAAVVALLSMLPPPPKLLFGEDLPEPDSLHTLDSDGGAESRNGDAESGANRESKVLWAAALRTLRGLPVPQALDLLESGRIGSAGTEFTRIWLVKLGTLDIEHLAKCWNICVKADPAVGDVLMLPLASAALPMHQPAQQQLLLATFDAVHVSDQPRQALKAAAVLTAAFSSAAAGPALDALVSAHSARIAVSTLPHTLTALLKMASWQQASGAFAERIVKLQELEEDACRALGFELLVAMRDYLPADILRHMSKAAILGTSPRGIATL